MTHWHDVDNIGTRNASYGRRVVSFCYRAGNWRNQTISLSTLTTPGIYQHIFCYNQSDWVCEIHATKQ
jgi:hypothetical protein